MTSRVAGAVPLVLCAVATPAIAGQTTFNTDLISNLPLTQLTDISASGDLVFVGRDFHGIAIIDVSDVDSPDTLSTWDHPTANIIVRDVKPVGTTLWCTNERDEDFGCFALNICDPSAPTLILELAPPVFPPRVHNIWADGTDIYLSGYNLSGYAVQSASFIVDASDPTCPTIRSLIEQGMHDDTVVGDSLYHAGGWSGLYFYDVQNPDEPALLGSYSSTDADTMYYAHSAYPIAGTSLVFLTEEIQRPTDPPEEGRHVAHEAAAGAGSLRLVDFSDPANPEAVWRYKSETAKADSLVTPHNAYVVGNFMYLSHYQDGLKIFDVTVPDDPVEVAFYDTYPDLPTTLFQGCWGVDAFQGTDRIFLSDRTYGFFHVAFNGARRTELHGRVRDASTLLVIGGASVRSATADRTVLTDFLGGYSLKSGSGSHLIIVSADGYVPDVAQLTLEPNGSLERDVFLSPTAVTVPASALPAVLVAHITPNPTRGAVSIEVEIPAALTGRGIEVGIHDVSGRLIRMLERGDTNDGRVALVWDARTASGFPVANGVYVVRVRADEMTVSERFVVAR